MASLTDRAAGRARIQAESQISRGGDAGRGLVADQSRQLGQRSNLRGGPQIALVGEALLIEGQDVEHHRGGIKEARW